MANRDEFYERPTSKADFWDDHPDLLAGRDLEANGTWMGVTRQGRISMLTNYRDLANIKPNAPSRGHLVSDFLTAPFKPKNYLETLEQAGRKYNSYNIVLGTIDDLWYYSNEGERIYQLGSGVYGLSNHLLNTEWPKVTKGKEKLEHLLSSDDFGPSNLFDAMFDDNIAPDNQLPDTGVGLERERWLSSMFIKSPKYGTRCSSAIMVDNDNNLQFVERTYDLNTFDFTEVNKKFKISK